MVFFRKPGWTLFNRLNFSKYHIRRFVTSLSTSVLSVDVSEIGRYDAACFWFLVFSTGRTREREREREREVYLPCQRMQILMMIVKSYHQMQMVYFNKHNSK